MNAAVKRTDVTLNPAALKRYERNARTHSKDQVQQIVRSITEYGFTNPILIDENNQIIAGHGRLEAAIELKLTAVPCVMLTGLTETQKRALVLADNQLALNAGWDANMLKSELSFLKENNYDISLIGFPDVQLGRFFPPKARAGQDDVPDLPAVPKSVTGDIWLLGDHRVMCGDSTVQTDLDALMKGEQADMLWTDPPWNVNYGDVPKGNAQKYKPRKILNDHMPEDKWADFVAGFCASFFIATKPGAMAYVVMSAQEWPSADLGLRNAGFHWSSTIIWRKNSLIISRKDYHTQYEPMWYGWNGSAPRLHPLEDRKQSDVWDIDRPTVNDLHPTKKPVELIERSLTNSSKRGALVIDFFGGSGSTLIACEKNGRRAYLMEKDPQYADVIVKRWQDFTGKMAVHAVTGEAFGGTGTARKDGA